MTHFSSMLLQLVEKDPEAAIVLFWKAINTGDRVDSALKDMAVVMKQQDRAEEAIEAINSFRHRCSKQAQESLDNVLLDLYKVNTYNRLEIFENEIFSLRLFVIFIVDFVPAWKWITVVENESFPAGCCIYKYIAFLIFLFLVTLAFSF